MKAAAEIRLQAMFARIEAQLGDERWLLGERFSAADLFLFMLIRWGRSMEVPPRSRAGLMAFAERVLERALAL